MTTDIVIFTVINTYLHALEITLSIKVSSTYTVCIIGGLEHIATRDKITEYLHVQTTCIYVHVVMYTLLIPYMPMYSNVHVHVGVLYCTSYLYIHTLALLWLINFSFNLCIINYI